MLAWYLLQVILGVRGDAMCIGIPDKLRDVDLPPGWWRRTSLRTPRGGLDTPAPALSGLAGAGTGQRRLISSWPLIDAWLSEDPPLTPAQVWKRLVDDHDVDITYGTVAQYTARHRLRLLRAHSRAEVAKQYPFARNADHTWWVEPMSRDAVFEAIRNHVTAGEYLDWRRVNTPRGPRTAHYRPGSAAYLSAYREELLEPLSALVPATADTVRKAEDLIGFPLPLLLRRLYLEVADGDSDPAMVSSAWQQVTVPMAGRRLTCTFTHTRPCRCRARFTRTGGFFPIAFSRCAPGDAGSTHSLTARIRRGRCGGGTPIPGRWMSGLCSRSPLPSPSGLPGGSLAHSPSPSSPRIPSRDSGAVQQTRITGGFNQTSYAPAEFRQHLDETSR